MRLAAFLLTILTACALDPPTSSIDDNVETAAAGSDDQQAPLPPPGQMQAGQTCIDGSLIPGERCAPGLRCVRDAPALPIGLCVRVVGGGKGSAVVP